MSKNAATAQPVLTSHTRDNEDAVSRKVRVNKRVESGVLEEGAVWYKLRVVFAVGIAVTPPAAAEVTSNNLPGNSLILEF